MHLAWHGHCSTRGVAFQHDNTIAPTAWLRRPGDRCTRTALLLGGTGFVGRHLSPALRSLDWGVRVASRDPERTQRPIGADVVAIDMRSQRSFVDAMHDVDTIFYLVHQTGDDGYAARELELAEMVASAAHEASVRSIVYLGGVAPDGIGSAHLRARLETGHLLREAFVPTTELRAAMVVGAGSASFELARELIESLPILPSTWWTNLRSSPVAIDDVVLALCWAAARPPHHSTWFDVHGPSLVRHADMLGELARALRSPRPEVALPFVSPSFAARVACFFSRQPSSLIRELVQGLAFELPPQRSVFPRMEDSLGLEPGSLEPISLPRAVRLALGECTRARSIERPSPRARRRISLRVRSVLGRAPDTRESP